MIHEFRVYFDDEKNVWVADSDDLQDTGTFSEKGIREGYEDFAPIMALAEAIGYDGADIIEELGLAESQVDGTDNLTFS